MSFYRKALFGLLMTAVAVSACGDSAEVAATEELVAATNNSADNANDNANSDNNNGKSDEAPRGSDNNNGHNHDHHHDAIHEQLAEFYNSDGRVAPPGIGVTDYVDIPAEAWGPAIDPAKGYHVGEIRNGVYWVTEGVYQAIFVVTDDGVVVADTPPSLAAAMPNAIADVTDLPVTHIIYSHAHSDHIGGVTSVWDEGVEIIAQEATLEELEERNDPNRPLPTVTFDEEFTLTTGGTTIEMYYPGTNHQEGNIFILVPEADVMMFVDVIFPGWSPWQYLAIAQDIPGFMGASAQLLDYEWDTLVAGHVGRLGTREDVEVQIEFATDLQAAAGDALANNSFDEAYATTAENTPDDLSPWSISDAFLDAVVADCVAEMAPKWNERLAGLDVFLYTHCQAMEQSLRVD